MVVSVGNFSVFSYNYRKGEIFPDQDFLWTLKNSIIEFMNVKDSDLRVFFESQAPKLNLFINHMLKNIVPKTQADTFTYIDRLYIYEVGRIVTVLYLAGAEFRKSSYDRYGILPEEKPCIEPSLYSIQIIGYLEILFRVSESMINSLDSSSLIVTESMVQLEQDPVSLRAAMTNVLCHLAEIIMESFQMTLKYFNRANKVREYDSLMSKRNTLVPYIYQTLKSLNRQDEAFRLSENFLDFENLVKMTLVDKNREGRLRIYMQTFGTPFAQVLYSEYNKIGFLI